MDVELSDHLGYDRGEAGLAEIPERHHPEDGVVRGRPHSILQLQGELIAA